MSTLSLEGISKRFGGLEAVAGVHMTVEPGKITGLIGPNGAGKSTIVNLTTGLMKPSAGRILLDGRDITHLEPHRIATAGIARTFQNIRLLAEATVFDNVLVGFHKQQAASLLAALLWRPHYREEFRRVHRQTRQMLERFGMTHYSFHTAGDLAYGHQRRVEMMRALATQPKVLLLDEPVAGMNDVEADELGRIFNEVAASGVAVLLIEHNVGFVAKMCAEVHVLDAGRLIASGPPHTVMRDPAVIAAYIGE